MASRLSPSGSSTPHGEASSLFALEDATTLANLIAEQESDAEETPGQIDENSKLLAHNDGAAAASRYDGTASYDPTSEPDSKRRSWKRKMYYYIPGTHWIPHYSLSLLTGDVLAGTTVASMLIPQSVSYASSLAHLSPVSGLFSASIPPIAYAMLGRCPQLNVAPEAALSLIVGNTIRDFMHEYPEDGHESDLAIGISVATAITVQVGLISFVLGFLRLGFMDVLLSRAMLHGFISAVAIIILIEQIIPMLGLTAIEHIVNPETTLDKVGFLFNHVLSHTHRTSACVSGGALIALILLRYLKRHFHYIRRLPEVFVVVAISTFISQELRWDEAGVAILGSVPIHTGKLIQFPISALTLPYLSRTTTTAATICVIGFLDSIVATKQMAMRFGYPVSPNRELVALGAGNLLGSLIPGAIPVAGSITRSRINADVGATTQMASLVCSVWVLLATFFLLPLLYYLPKPVLGSIICLVVFSLLEEAPHALMYYWRMRAWIDMALTLLTFALIIVFDVEIGIVVAVIISLLLVVHRSSKSRMTILGHLPGTDKWKPIDENPEAKEDVPGALIVRLRENLDFANSSQLKERLRRMELGTHTSHPSAIPQRPQAHILVFHMADLDHCDASAVQVMYELFESYKTRGVKVFVTHLRKLVRVSFERGKIVQLLGEESFFDNLADAMKVVESLERA